MNIVRYSAGGGNNRGQRVMSAKLWRCTGLVMEALEPRLFLSVSLDDSTGLLSIVGTRHADRIDVRFFPGNDDAGDFTAAYVTVNGRHKTFDHVAGLQVDARGGEGFVVGPADASLDAPASIHTTLIGFAVC